MYVPAHFAVTDLPVLQAFIDRYPFGEVISQHDGRPFVTHLPFLLDRIAGTPGVLRGHVARQNPHWQSLVGPEVLAVFHGPHAYVSPGWYQSDRVVPTWNYVAAHVYGRVELIENEDELIQLVLDLTDRSESRMVKPWTFDPADPYVRKLTTQIVGFRMTIERIEGKWKLNQNHPPERRRRVIAALRDEERTDSLEIADLMEQDLAVKPEERLS